MWADFDQAEGRFGTSKCRHHTEWA